MQQWRDERPYPIAERAFEFAVDCIALCRRLQEADPPVRTLCVQLIKAASSVGANLEEASAGFSRREFAARVSVALKEAREAHYWLRLLQAATSTQKTTAPMLLAEANQLVAVLGTIVRHARDASGSAS